MGDERGPSLDQRIERARLTPQAQEAARATLLVAELLDDILTELRGQTGLLRDIRDRQPEPVTVINHISGLPPGSADEGKGDEAVQLREPAVPPPDPDTTTDGGPVADPATSGTSARRTPAKKATGKTPAKATKAAPAGRRGKSSGSAS